MKEALIKEIQKYLNQPFRYKQLLAFLDKKRDILLNPEVMQKVDANEYNALWDMILDIENHFKFASDDNYAIGVEMSVLSIFDHNFKQRQSHNGR